jgi:hypothetical protein
MLLIPSSSTLLIGYKYKTSLVMHTYYAQQAYRIVADSREFCSLHLLLEQRAKKAAAERLPVIPFFGSSKRTAKRIFETCSQVSKEIADSNMAYHESLLISNWMHVHFTSSSLDSY